MPDSQVLLRGIRWETYERLLVDLDGSALRLTYDDGDLEIVTLSHRHERWKGILARMVETMTEELEIPILSGGSTTLRRRDLKKGLEPDECYWVQNEARVRGKYDLDLRVDPAPDLVIEAEASRSVLDRLGILAALGVGEVWRFDGKKLSILLGDEAGSFVERPRSRCFPWLPIEPFAAHVPAIYATDETTWIRGFRAWVASQRQAWGI